jgi:Lon protease-like protein
VAAGNVPAENQPEEVPGPRLPLFPLGTVLFPGLVLPLHVFEARYRTLVRDLEALPDGVAREFGVVAIRRGWEVGLSRRAVPASESAAADGPAEVEPADGTLVAGDSLTLYEVGCTAEVRTVSERPDGRFDLVTVGRRRFRVVNVDRAAAPYLVAEVEWLPDSTGEPDRAEDLATGVLAAFQRYLRLLRRTEPDVGEQLPDDPTVLSHLVAATASLTLDDRQRLLAAPDTVSRLRAERAMLRREAALLRKVRAVPVPLPDLAVPSSPN